MLKSRKKKHTVLDKANLEAGPRAFPNQCFHPGWSHKENSWPAGVKFLDVIVMNQLTWVDQQKFIWVDYGRFFYASLSWHKLGYLGIVIHSPFTIIPSWQELHQQRQGVTEQTGDLNIRNEGLNGGAILAIPCFFWEFNMAWC